MTRRIQEVATGKTANIISKDQLAIAVGAEAGVEIGDSVVVRNSVEIKDPDTQKVLGVYHQTRLRLRVSLVGKMFSIATVTDPVPTSVTLNISAALDSTRVRRTKTIVRTESSESETEVWVKPGESVAITRVIKDDDDESGQ